MADIDAPRIMLVCRLMTGFEESVKTRIWRPTGGPAIHHLMDSIDQGKARPRFIFTRAFSSLEEDRKARALRGRSIAIEGLQTPVTVLAELPSWLASISGYLREFVHVLHVALAVRNTRPDVLYVDRGNILIGAIFARFSSVPVFLRLMGTPPYLKEILKSRHPSHMVLRWAFRSPFAYVLCTRDGSGGEVWMQKALEPSVPWELLLNGVARPVPTGKTAAPLKGVQRDAMLVTMLGRVESIKGTDFFVKALLLTPQGKRCKIHGLVIGEGALLDELKRQVREAGASDRITFTGALDREQVADALLKSDVYVSLNRQGHLSNSTLEAMTSGVCMVVQQCRDGGLRDDEFEDIVPPEAILQIERTAGPEALTRCLCELAKSPKRRQRLAKALRQAVDSKLWSWDERIAYEIDLLRQIASSHMP